ncbi:capsular biosynthesis protein, partial [Salmonella enterica]|nr:capsular biosynthesis protein [Salmonella enterica]
MTTIVIPMAGQSSRFYNAGYTVPKYKLRIDNKSVFYYALKGFNSFKEHFFLIIGIKNILDENFVIKEMLKLGFDNYEIVLLDHPTNGQAETVVKGIEACGNKINDIMIFNIDTFRKDINFPVEFDIGECYGYLETFIGTGMNWSNILPKDHGSHEVRMTAEKQGISEYCCTGLYYFKDFSLLSESYYSWLKNNCENNEIY